MSAVKLPTTPAVDHMPASPTALTRLAHDALDRARGRSLPSEELGCAMFGLVSPSAPGRWAGVVDAVLGQDARFVRASGGWALAHTEPAADDGSVVALAIATTGARPGTHGIVRVSAVRRGSDGVIARFDSPVNVRRRLPRYLSTAARVSQDEADAAPGFGEIVGDLRDVLGDGPLHAYGAGWVRAFIGAELERLDSVALPNDFVELGDADLAPPDGRKPTLVSLAEGLRINHPRPGYPPADADVAARIALALRDRHSAGNPRSPAGDQHPPAGDQHPPASDPHPPAGDPRLPALDPRTPAGDLARRSPPRPALLAPAWLADVPSGPGVYLIEDDAGEILYVGKAVDLRRRLATYMGRAFPLHRRLDGLAARASRVRTEPSATDIEARLLEARLVRRYLPPFNVQRTARRSATVVRVGLHDVKPSARLVRDVSADGAIYFGPYRSARVARAQLDLAREVFPLVATRTAGSLDDRRAACRAASGLLSGQKHDALALLRARMRTLSAVGDLLAVDQTRRLVSAVLDLEPCPSPLLGLSPTEPLLVVEHRPDRPSARAHLVRDGVLVASADVRGSSDRPALVRLAAVLEAESDPPATADDASITLRWLMEPAQNRTIIPLRQLRGPQ